MLRTLCGLLFFTVLVVAPYKQAKAVDLGMETAAAVAPPLEFIRFCARNFDDCKRQSNATTESPAFGKQRFSDLAQVQSLVNRVIKPTADYKQHGKADVWTYPTFLQGDCEDYALQKRRLLIKRGWRPQDLLLTTAITEQGEPHVVLTARTTAGDFILDNRYDEVVGWQKMPYRWLARQSAANPLRWKKLTGQERGQALADAGVIEIQ